MADFVNTLKGASDYINNTNVNIPTNITGDVGTGVITAQTTSFSVKEIVCGILAGNGFKLPNIQLCLKINLSRLIPALPAALGALSDILAKALSALDNFISHTGIGAVLDRLNAAIADFAAIANMINFCGTPVIPRPIPNVLGDLMGSFTGAGQDILDKLGKIADSDIGGCVGIGGTIGGGAGVSISDVNFGIFEGGALKDIGDLIEELSVTPQGLDIQSRIDNIKFELDGFVSDMEELIEFENNYKTIDTTQPRPSGGSVFTPTDRIHTGVGVGMSDDLSFSEASGMAGQLQHTYDQLSQYSVDDEGNNIFHYLLEPELVARLDANSNPEPVVVEQQAEYDYCGKVTGYTNTVVSGNTDVSSGQPFTQNVQPGANAINDEENTTQVIAELQNQIVDLTARLDALEGNN